MRARAEPVCSNKLTLGTLLHRRTSCFIGMPIERSSAADVRHSLSEFVEVLRDVVDGGSSVGFMAPLRAEDAAKYWNKIADDVDRGDRVVLVVREENCLAGCVHLVPAQTANGLHRAEVQKMLVHSRYRRRGLGRALISAAEQHAREMKRSLLVLDTERNSAGEAFYSACGWVRSGVIPNFASNWNGTALIDTVIYYKLLQ